MHAHSHEHVRWHTWNSLGRDTLWAKPQQSSAEESFGHRGAQTECQTCDSSGLGEPVSVVREHILLLARRIIASQALTVAPG